jgi:hypothetical protein
VQGAAFPRESGEAVFGKECPFLPNGLWSIPGTGAQIVYTDLGVFTPGSQRFYRVKVL